MPKRHAVAAEGGVRGAQRHGEGLREQRAAVGARLLELRQDVHRRPKQAVGGGEKRGRRVGAGGGGIASSDDWRETLDESHVEGGRKGGNGHVNSQQLKNENGGEMNGGEVRKILERKEGRGTELVSKHVSAHDAADHGAAVQADAHDDGGAVGRHRLRARPLHLERKAREARRVLLERVRLPDHAASGRDVGVTDSTRQKGIR